MAKTAMTMLVYAVVILVIGFTTYTVALPGAKAMTALVIPLAMAGVMIACAVGTLLIGSNRKLGLLGLYAGIVLPLVFALLVSMRLPKSLGDAMEFKNAVSEAANGVTVGKRRDEGVPHPAGYQAVGMMALVTLSGMAFAVLVLHWPTPPPARERTALPDDEPSMP